MVDGRELHTSKGLITCTSRLRQHKRVQAARLGRSTLAADLAALIPWRVPVLMPPTCQYFCHQPPPTYIPTERVFSAERPLAYSHGFRALAWHHDLDSTIPQSRSAPILVHFPAWFSYARSFLCLLHLAVGLDCHSASARAELLHSASTQLSRLCTSRLHTSTLSPRRLQHDTTALLCLDLCLFYSFSASCTCCTCCTCCGTLSLCQLARQSSSFAGRHSFPTYTTSPCPRQQQPLPLPPQELRDTASLGSCMAFGHGFGSSDRSPPARSI